ncbi:mechanosensitive ion channel family protein [Dermacoccus nishinomiyaensis]|uniref:mechanosensitive ion channel family protein n=1 Tax=Dermacoccus nishinomiyaensis TaxID=1274 RepID=UPI001EF7351E|nr:mechanosensitive ion channel family protein [Dermacoccus nishinomiyaensis]MCG7429344.1 mechanosensitive ion channel family protein [Dermacoccus nishinomiyaensis]
MSSTPLSLGPLRTSTMSDLWHHVGGTPVQVVIIAVAAVAVRWLAHRAISRAVEAMIARPRSTRSGQDETRVATDEAGQPTGAATPPAQAPEGAGDAAGEAEGAAGSTAVSAGDLLAPTRARLRAAAGLDDERRRQRAATMGSLLRSITTVAIVIVATLTIAAQCGIQLGPIMASAGVAGVALGFGAQSLVKDYLSGIFMIFEDQYGVGDVIDTGEAIGTVEEVTLRITRLRDANGVVWYVRNGEIVRVANRSQGWSTSLVDIPVAYDSDIHTVTHVLEDVVDALEADPEWSEKLIERPNVAGVESVAGGTMTFRIIAKTAPNENFGVSRELRRRSVMALEDAGVKGPPAQPFAAVNTALPR